MDEAGFALFGLAVVVFIVAVAAAVTAPLLRQQIIERRSAAVIGDLRAFAGAFQAHAHERGDWPPGHTAPGTIPSGMEVRLASTLWQQPSPIGGKYRWTRRTLQQGVRYEAAIVISDIGPEKVTRDRNQLEAIDRKIDDGDLTTGKFRLGFRDQPVFVVEN
ncbi:MAG: hypothetical protein Q7S40_10810 [Opitutaceae bacterium]|nr:hypothetical protein [Opitutaceae bacterium]